MCCFRQWSFGGLGDQCTEILRHESGGVRNNLHVLFMMNVATSTEILEMTFIVYYKVNTLTQMCHKLLLTCMTSGPVTLSSYLLSEKSDDTAKRNSGKCILCEHVLKF